MTGPDDVSRETSTPWRQYLDREHAARDQYLAVTRRAHHEYLSGPWPDRDYYLTVERDAYATYYAAGRDAWKTYRTDMETTPPPVVAPGPVALAREAAWMEKSGHPYPQPPAAPNPGRPNIFSPEHQAPWPTERDVSPGPAATGFISDRDGRPAGIANPNWPPRNVNDTYSGGLVAQPSFNPITLGGEPVQIDPDQDRYQASDHRPESER